MRRAVHFSQNAQARNISHHGAKLAGLEKQLKPGDVIGVQFGDKKARCKVIWVVDAGTAQKIEVGVKMLEGQPCPWQKEMEPRQPLRLQLGSRNRAHALRRATREISPATVPFPIEIRDEQGGGAAMRTKTADINGSGCYVETMLPLPVGKVLNITFWLGANRSTPRGCPDLRWRSRHGHRVHRPRRRHSKTAAAAG